AAMGLCPKGVFLPVRMSRYKEVSDEIFEIFHRFTPLVEPLSIDEAFLDATDSERLFGNPEQIAKKIKRTVAEEIGLTVSAGIAPCKFVAKIASDLHKPDGLTVVPQDKVNAFLAPLSIDKLWGVGKATQKALARLGVRTIGDLSRLPPEMLEKRFGKHGIHLHLLSRGIDERDVEPVREVKSIGGEETFAEDILHVDVIKRELLSLATRVSRRMRRQGLAGKTVTLKVKYHDFVRISRSKTLPDSTDDEREIFRSCCGLLEKTEAGKRPVRLLGISLSHLCSKGDQMQLSLFEAGISREKSKRLNLAVDKIQEKFGEGAILPSTLLEG
ncbi:MAG: DNA polymerase IV, partial [Desulfobacterales bacterium]|nr:DNA polymerase IV [Desulfobacterales bacterium]